MNATKITALEFANANENVIVRYASQGAPAGCDIAWMAETYLPFDLEDVEGVVEDCEFTATNLNVEGGAHGWQFTDFNANYVYGLWLRVDAKEWDRQYEELMAE